MSLKKRIDFAYLGFKGEIDIILLNFKKGFPFSREVTTSRIFFIKVCPVSFKNFRLTWWMICKYIRGYKEFRKMICYIICDYFMWCKIIKDIINKGLGVTIKLNRLDFIKEERAGCTWGKKIICWSRIIIIKKSPRRNMFIFSFNILFISPWYLTFLDRLFQ